MSRKQLSALEIDGGLVGTIGQTGLKFTRVTGADVPIVAGNLLGLDSAGNVIPTTLPAIPSTPTRALNTTFTPSATHSTWVSYTVEISCSASLLGGQTGSVQLLSDSASTPTTIRDEVLNTNSVSLAIAITAVNTQRASIRHLVPPGHTVKLVSSGTATISLVRQTEVTV